MRALAVLCSHHASLRASAVPRAAPLPAEQLPSVPLLCLSLALPVLLSHGSGVRESWDRRVWLRSGSRTCFRVFAHCSRYRDLTYVTTDRTRLCAWPTSRESLPWRPFGWFPPFGRGAAVGPSRRGRLRASLCTCESVSGLLSFSSSSSDIVGPLPI